MVGGAGPPEACVRPSPIGQLAPTSGRQPPLFPTLTHQKHAHADETERLIAAEVRKARGPPPPTAPSLTSPLLARAAAFLPALAQANQELAAAIAAAPPGTFDVEGVDDEAAPHVEMEVACGVLDLKDEDAVRAAEAALAAGGGGLGLSEEGGAGTMSDGSSGEGDDASDSASESRPPGERRPPHPRRKRRAGIEEVG